MTRRVSWLAFCLLASFSETSQHLAETGSLSVETDSRAEPVGYLPCSATSAAEAAAMRLRVELPPVPPYPDNGNIPEELRDRLVFLDVETGDLIVSFPPRSDFEGLEPDQEMEGGRIKDRMFLALATCPSLSVAVYPSGDPRMRRQVYHYRLHNRRQARQSIRQMVLPIPLTQEAMPVYDLVSPYGWHVRQWDGPKEGEFMHSRLRAMTFTWGDAFREEMRRSMIRRRVTWHSALSKHRLEPGNRLDAYMLSTEARPGIVRAYIVGAIERFPRPHSPKLSWGEGVDNQVWAFDWLENNSLSIGTIGPKYLPNMDKRRIASDFVNSLEDLIRHGEVEVESTFIQEVLQRLEAVAEGDGGAVDPASWPAKTETDFEAEILMAIRLSLGK